MKLGTLVLAGMCGAVGLVAGRVSAPVSANVVAAAPTPVVPTIAPTIVARVPVANDEPPPVDPAEADDDDGRDPAAVLVAAKQQAAALEHTHQVIRGHVTDPSGQGIAGVTVIASGQSGAIAAITDEHGAYEITNLPPANYLVTFYYCDQTIERPGIATRAVEPTELDLSFDPNVHPSYDSEPSISFSGGTSLENTYVVDE